MKARQATCRGCGTRFTVPTGAAGQYCTLPGVVVGHTPTRVQIELTLAQRGGTRVRRAVNAESLIVGAL